MWMDSFTINDVEAEIHDSTQDQANGLAVTDENGKLLDAYIPDTSLDNLKVSVNDPLQMTVKEWIDNVQERANKEPLSEQDIDLFCPLLSATNGDALLSSSVITFLSSYKHVGENSTKALMFLTDRYAVVMARTLYASRDLQNLGTSVYNRPISRGISCTEDIAIIADATSRTYQWTTSMFAGYTSCTGLPSVANNVNPQPFEVRKINGKYYMYNGQLGSVGTGLSRFKGLYTSLDGKAWTIDTTFDNTYVVSGIVYDPVHEDYIIGTDKGLFVSSDLSTFTPVITQTWDNAAVVRVIWSDNLQRMLAIGLDADYWLAIRGIGTNFPILTSPSVLHCMDTVDVDGITYTLTEYDSSYVSYYTEDGDAWTSLGLQVSKAVKFGSYWLFSGSTGLYYSLDGKTNLTKIDLGFSLYNDPAIGALAVTSSGVYVSTHKTGEKPYLLYSENLQEWSIITVLAPVNSNSYPIIEQGYIGNNLVIGWLLIKENTAEPMYYRLSRDSAYLLNSIAGQNYVFSIGTDYIGANYGILDWMYSREHSAFMPAYLPDALQKFTTYYNGSMWLRYGASNTLAYSLDGKTFTPCSGTYKQGKICWSGTTWFMVTSTSISYSDDGITWQKTDFTSIGFLVGNPVAIKDKVFVRVSSSPYNYTLDSNGAVDGSAIGHVYKGVYRDNTYYLHTSKGLVKSSDGTNYTIIASLTGTLNSASFSENRLAAMSDNVYKESVDGEHWTEYTFDVNGTCCLLGDIRIFFLGMSSNLVVRLTWDMEHFAEIPVSFPWTTARQFMQAINASLLQNSGTDITQGVLTFDILKYIYNPLAQ